MKRRVLSQVGVLVILFCTFLIKAEVVSAFNDYEMNLGETISVKSQYGIEYVDINGIKSKIQVKVEIANVSAYDSDGNVIQDTIKVCYDEDADKEWYVTTGGTLTFTDYVDEYEHSLQLDAVSASKFSLDLRVTKVSDAKLTISCHKSITMKDTGLKKVCPDVYYGDEDVSEYAKIKVKTNKKNLVDIDTSDLDIDGYFYLGGNYKSGKCKITVTAKYKGQTCSDSFTLNIKSTLKNNLYVLGDLFRYNARSNIFKMSLTNRSKKQITIISKGAVALDDDYASFDRNVKMTKNRNKIVIKPGKSKTISWKVLGNTTWHKVGDFEIHFKCKYKGKVCWLSVQEESVYIWKKGKWRKMS